MSRYRADEDLPCFCTITVLDWLPVLIEARYIEPILDSLRYCRANKGLKLLAFVIMPNHVHLIASAGQRLHEVMRDFKRFTSRQIHERLKADGRESLLHWLEYATPRARRGRGELGLWQDGFHPQAIWSAEVFRQKLDYLHTNPCRKGLVQQPQHWSFSSAAAYAGEGASCTEIDPPEF
jgi:putative transposase